MIDILTAERVRQYLPADTPVISLTVADTVDGLTEKSLYSSELQEKILKKVRSVRFPSETSLQ